ncbi:hypothetical protein [Paenibacillus caseinilyticus]|nr:hypothetical protein [Paenibacillus caseinilyticus]MCZ8521128.1 hypothetical protein [Paenibacillus caseinilyticus]
MDVYELHWWKIPYTLAALNFFFHFAKAWAKGLARGSRPLAFLTLFTSAFSLAATLMFALSLGGVRLFQAGLFLDPYRDDVFLATLDAAVKAAVLSGVLCWTRSRVWWGGALLLFAGLQLFLIGTGRLLLFMPQPAYFAMYMLCCLAVLVLLSKVDDMINRFAQLR